MFLTCFFLADLNFRVLQLKHSATSLSSLKDILFLIMLHFTVGTSSQSGLVPRSPLQSPHSTTVPPLHHPHQGLHPMHLQHQAPHRGYPGMMGPPRAPLDSGAMRPPIPGVGDDKASGMTELEKLVHMQGHLMASGDMAKSQV